MVDERTHHVAHVVGLTHRRRHQVGDCSGRSLVLGIGNVFVLGGSDLARGGQIVQERAHVVDRLFLGVGHVVGDAGLEVVDRRAAELVERHLFAGRCSDDVRARHEHVRVLARHDDEVGEGRLIHGATGAGAQDD